MAKKDAKAEQAVDRARVVAAAIASVERGVPVGPDDHLATVFLPAALAAIEAGA